MALFVAAALALAACSGSSDLSAEVVRSLDIPGEAVAVVGDSISEPIPTTEILQAVAVARSAGTELRVVIAGDDVDLVDPTAVVDRYGGTVLSYKTSDLDFRTSSSDIDDGQLNRARDAAQVVGIGPSVTAFAGLLEEEGGVVPKPGNALRWLLWVGLAVCALIFFWQLGRFRSARARSKRLSRAFDERQASLHEWVSTLKPEVDRLAPFSTRLDAAQLRQLDESKQFLESIDESISRSTSLPDLDAAEMRISRTAIKLRDLRHAADV